MTKQFAGGDKQTDRQTDRQILWHHIWWYVDFFFQLNLLHALLAGDNPKDVADDFKFIKEHLMNVCGSSLIREAGVGNHCLNE